MIKTDDDKDTILTYVPKRDPSINWRIVWALLLAWVVVLVAAFMIRSRMIMLVLPVLMIVLLVYLVICTVSALRRR